MVKERHERRDKLNHGWLANDQVILRSNSQSPGMKMVKTFFMHSFMKVDQTNAKITLDAFYTYHQINFTSRNA